MVTYVTTPMLEDGDIVHMITEFVIINGKPRMIRSFNIHKGKKKEKQQQQQQRTEHAKKEVAQKVQDFMDIELGEEGF